MTVGLRALIEMCEVITKASVFSHNIAKKKINSHFALCGKIFPTIPSTWKFVFFLFFRQNRRLRWRFALSTKLPHEVAVRSKQTAISCGGLVPGKPPLSCDGLLVACNFFFSFPLNSERNLH